MPKHEEMLDTPTALPLPVLLSSPLLYQFCLFRRRLKVAKLATTDGPLRLCGCFSFGMLGPHHSGMADGRHLSSLFMQA